MDIRLMKDTAAGSLQRAAYSPTKLGFYHTAAALLASLLVTVAGYFLQQQINGAVGLAGMGMRALWEVVLVVLNLAVMILMPFWNAGFTGVSLQLARRRSPGPDALPEGFRRALPLLRLYLLRTVFTAVLVFAAFQVSTILYTMTPLGDPLLEAMAPMMEASMYGSEMPTLSPEQLDQLIPLLMPVYVLAAVLGCVIILPILYRFRLAEFAIMDDAKGAMDALRRSAKMMKNRRWKFFRLELSFWWYYLLQILAAALVYGDLLLAQLGVPVSPELAYFGCYGLSLLAQLLLGTAFMPKVQTTFATAYDSLHIGYEEKMEIIDL